LRVITFQHTFVLTPAVKQSWSCSVRTPPHPPQLSQPTCFKYLVCFEIRVPL
jgi:hypothetical protein